MRLTRESAASGRKHALGRLAAALLIGRRLPMEGQQAVRSETELALLFVVAAVRLTFLGQLLVAVPASLGRASRPGLYAFLVALTICESVALFVVLWQRREFTSSRFAWLDVLFISVMISLEPLYSLTEDRVGTWVAWGFPAGTIAAFNAGVGMAKWWQTGTAVGLLVTAYVAASLPGSSEVGTTGTIWANTVAFLGFAGIARVSSSFLRRISVVADQARHDAAVAARRAELDRHRLLLHDQATILRMLSEPILDPELGVLLRTQAGNAADRIRLFLDSAADETVASEVGDLRLLAPVVARSAEAFTDQNVQLNLDLLRGVLVEEPVAEAITQALSTILQNVRVHAGAHMVTVHGDLLHAGQWEISVQDDGTGYDIGTTQPGFGLRVQAGSSLRAVGVSVQIDSAASEGTIVTLRGPSGDKHEHS